MARTAIQKEYEKNRRRIQRAIRRLESRGYLVPEGLLPNKPKRITAGSVRRLQKLDLETIYRRSRYVERETGEILKGTKGRQLERAQRREIASQRARERRRKPDYVDFSNQVFFMFQAEMNEIFYRNPAMLRVIETWFNKSLEVYGREDFAEALEKAKADGLFPNFTMLYDAEALNGSLNAILELIGGTEGRRAEIIESLEEMEDWQIYD